MIGFVIGIKKYFFFSSVKCVCRQISFRARFIVRSASSPVLYLWGLVLYRFTTLRTSCDRTRAPFTTLHCHPQTRYSFQQWPFDARRRFICTCLSHVSPRASAAVSTPPARAFLDAFPPRVQRRRARYALRRSQPPRLASSPLRRGRPCAPTVPSSLGPTAPLYAQCVTPAATSAAPAGARRKF